MKHANGFLGLSAKPICVFGSVGRCVVEGK